MHVNLYEKPTNYLGKQKYFSINISRNDGSCSVDWGNFSNWSYNNPGYMNINTEINNNNDVDEENMNVLAAHELGHILGLGDAYNVINDRWNPQSPNEDYEREWWQLAIDTSKYIFNIKGTDAKNNYLHGTTPMTYGNYEIPDTDIMRCGNKVSDFDIKLVLDALKNGELQQFPTK